MEDVNFKFLMVYYVGMIRFIISYFIYYVHSSPAAYFRLFSTFLDPLTSVM